jgi:Septum formation
MTGGPAAAPEPYYAPGWPAADGRLPGPRLDGLAVVGFVTAVVGLGLVGIGLGVAALVRIRRGRTSGRGLAIAAVAIGTVWTVVAAVVGVSLTSSWLATRPLPLEVEGPRTASVGRLVTGHCVGALPDDGDVGRVEVVPCDEPHAAQVISEYRFAPDAVWPGQDGANARVAVACELSTAEAEAGLRLVTWAPTEGSWADGDRTGLCVAYLAGGITGSLLDGSADVG